MVVDLAALAKPFPKEKVHWRAQTLTKDGNKAMALAYVDARDVMERLDEVCGPEGWQSEHFDCGGGKLGCRIGINLGVNMVKADASGESIKFCEHWVWKSDGAGETDIEGAKGAFSGAFKRAAVSWGIGRYLYDMDAVWVPCETTEWQGKKRFKRFTADPWNFVKQDRSGPPTPRDQGRAPSKQQQPGTEAKKGADSGGDEIIEGTILGMINGIRQTRTQRDLEKWGKMYAKEITPENLGQDGYKRVRSAFAIQKREIANMDEAAREEHGDPPWEEDEAGRQDDHVRTVLDAG